MTDVTVYGRHGCVQCRATTDKASQLGLIVTYVDLDQDSDTECRLVQEGFRELPVVYAGDRHWTGFRPDLLTDLV